MTQQTTTQQDIRTTDHNVLEEFNATSGSQTHNQRTYFIHTMTDSDFRKITQQLLNKQIGEVSISEGGSYRRTLENIEWERAFGKLSHLRA